MSPESRVRTTTKFFELTKDLHLVTNARHSFLLLGFPAQCEGRLQTVHQVEVPDINQRLHGANGYQATALVALGVET